MNVKVKAIAKTTVVEMQGRLNGNSQAIVEDQILPHLSSAKRVILEMSKVSFLSSFGLRTLLLLHRQISGAGGRLVLVGLSEELRDTMSMTGFLDFFTIYPTLAEGLEALEMS